MANDDGSICRCSKPIIHSRRLRDGPAQLEAGWRIAAGVPSEGGRIFLVRRRTFGERNVFIDRGHIGQRDCH
jgi:hypothetical protein